MKIETERLILRDLVQEDWQRIQEYQSDPLYLRYNRWTERTPEDVQKFIGRMMNFQQQEPRIKYQLAVVLKATHHLIGNCGVRMVTAGAVEADMGYELDPKHWTMIVDADTGFGNAINVQRTVRGFERAGAAMIQLEDQAFPKRCGHLDGKAVVPVAEMQGKLRAALDARHSAATLILARTDALAVEGLEAALDRAEAYLECGADALFVEALRTPEQMDAACSRCVIDNTSVLVAAGSGPEATIAPELAAFGRAYRVTFRAHRVGAPDRKARIERPFAPDRQGKQRISLGGSDAHGRSPHSAAPGAPNIRDALRGRSAEDGNLSETSIRCNIEVES